MKSIILKLLVIISRERKNQLLGIVALSVVAAFFEVATIGAVVPFLMLLTEPDKVVELSTYFKYMGLGNFDVESKVLIIVCVFGGLVLISGLLRFVLMKYQTNISFDIGGDISRKTFEASLYQSYDSYKEINTSLVVDLAIGKCRDVVNNLIAPLVTLCSSSILVLSVLCVLLWINPFVSTISFLFFGALYLFTGLLTRNRIAENSSELSEGQKKCVFVVQESLRGVREVILSKLQTLKVSDYSVQERRYRSAVKSIIIVSQSPRYLIETLGVLLIVILAAYYTISDARQDNVITALGVFAIGAQRLLPLLQQLYWAVSQIRGAQKSFDEIYMFNTRKREEELEQEAESVNFTRCIQFKNVSYAIGKKCILSNLDLQIIPGDIIGIVGPTGSGKSTFLDILLGLIQPTDGVVEIDGTIVKYDNLLAYRRLFSSVPQHVYIEDSTIEENVKFGGPELSRSNVERALMIAQLNTKDVSSLVGEAGINLSGGQKQRLGLARAIAKPFQILVLDEATSALDIDTERKVISAIHENYPSSTIIMVAHRLETLKNCNKIIRLENGVAFEKSSFTCG